MKIEARLQELGFILPEPLVVPAGTQLPFPWVRIQRNRAYISGHGPQLPDGSLAGPFGKVGAEVSPEQAYNAAYLIALAILGDLKRQLEMLTLKLNGAAHFHGRVASTDIRNAATHLSHRLR